MRADHRRWAAVVIVWSALLAAVPLGAQTTSRLLELNEAGWKAIEQKDGDRAARAFAAALDVKPADPVLLMGAGAAADLQGKPKPAMALLQKALAIEPRLTNASWLLGQIAYREGDLDLAIKVYTAALEYKPNDAGIKEALAAWRKDAAVHHSFEERRYDRFRVQFEGRTDEALAAKATDILDRAFWKVARTLGQYPSNAIVTVLYTEKQFRDITRAPEWSAGVYDGRIRIPVDGAGRSEALFTEVLTHELTHAIVANVAPRGVPVWLHEGLAQYFDGSDVEAARRRIKAVGGYIPLEQLEESFAGLSAAQARLAYDESLVAVAVMFDRPAFGWSQLLHQLSGGQPFYRAIETFGFTYADLENRFR